MIFTSPLLPYYRWVFFFYATWDDALFGYFLYTTDSDKSRTA
jgi:hypothetical protein